MNDSEPQETNKNEKETAAHREEGLLAINPFVYCISPWHYCGRKTIEAGFIFDRQYVVEWAIQRGDIE